MFDVVFKEGISDVLDIKSQEAPYRKFYFPSGEMGIEFGGISPTCKYCEVTANICTPDDIIELFLVLDAIQHQHEGRHITLTIPYIPFGRQDRHTTDSSPFSLKVFARMLNSFKLDKVITYSPHSNVTHLLIDNIETREPNITNFLVKTNLVERVGGSYDMSDIVFISPDSGAEKRVYCAAILCGVPEVRVCTKRRNPLTGEIVGMFAPADIPEDKHLVVVDDICDGGRTFIEVEKVLPKNRKSLSLFVTHGIFSKGREVLDMYDNIGCTFNFIEERLKNGRK